MTTQDPALDPAFDTAFDPFSNLDLERVAPSTEAQREVWLASQLSIEASLAFNEAIMIRLKGALSTQALNNSLQLLVARHESLRANFSEDGLQFVVASASNTSANTNTCSTTGNKYLNPLVPTVCRTHS